VSEITGSRKQDEGGAVDAAVVVVAAGAGVRLGAAEPKLLVDLAGRPLVAHSLSVFQDCLAVERIVLVVPAGLEAQARSDVVERFSLDKVCAIVAGGETRAESVYAGLVELGPDTGVVLIHDGARPLVSRDLVLRVLEAAERTGAAVPEIKCADTVKRVEGDVIVATLDRDRLRRIQTPQGFHYVLIREAYERSREQGEPATDDSALLEVMGTRVSTVPGSLTNLKITTAEDLVMAAALLAAGCTQ